MYGEAPCTGFFGPVGRNEIGLFLCQPLGIQMASGFAAFPEGFAHAEEGTFGITEGLLDAQSRQGFLLLRQFVALSGFHEGFEQGVHLRLFAVIHQRSAVLGIEER